ncbi:hypothetical protein Barb7_00336 [Bacteroidales bacterium Barb7]|nr:hypothetical protein Barb7_00336 [Bacteroidales bacterium Barb7]
MNVLFLIGNGFDINVGLKTCFKDALETYLNDQNNDPRSQKFKEDINQDFENWSDFEKQIGIYTEKFSHQSIEDYYFYIRSFRESLVKHLKNEESRINYNVCKADIASIFKKSIVNFYEGLLLTHKNIIESILNRERSIRYNFITFNYTNVLDNCLGILKKNGSLNNDVAIDHEVDKIVHVHGTTKEHVILGVDNVEQIKNKDLLIDEKLKRTIIKPFINKELNSLNDKECISLIEHSHIICIFGLSLGETDKSWWQTIEKRLRNVDVHLVIFDNATEFNPIHPEDNIDNINNAMKKFLLSAGITKNQNQYTDRIHIGFNTDIFKLDLTRKS